MNQVILSLLLIPMIILFSCDQIKEVFEPALIMETSCLVQARYAADIARINGYDTQFVWGNKTGSKDQILTHVQARAWNFDKQTWVFMCVNGNEIESCNQDDFYYPMIWDTYKEGDAKIQKEIDRRYAENRKG